MKRRVLDTSVRAFAVAVALACSCPAADPQGSALLPDGSEFAFWEKPLRFTRTYYVDNRNPKASDSNPGTAELPFVTINKAAQVLQPGERVVVNSGVYRERVSPARGGAGPERMISYEAAPGASVLVKGSRVVKTGWKPSAGFSSGFRNQGSASTTRIYQVDLEPLQLGGYNPFGMVNMLDDRGASSNIGAPPQGLKPYLLRRGLVFADGKRLEQVEQYRGLTQKDGTYWAEHNGLIVHVRLPGDASPQEHEVELVVQEQVFAPRERHLSYIRVKGITFEHAANGFPVPQRGLVSAHRGHHWIIEDCTIRHANAVGLDVGNETWNADRPSEIGYAIVRRNHISDIGVCGIAGSRAMGTLIEDNLIERVGWQDVEPMWESGGIKLHETKSCLLRRNVIRHLRYAPAVWLDYANINTRLTGNLMADIQDSLRGGVYLEASHDSNMLDQNIIWNTSTGERSAGGPARATRREGGMCILVDGSDDSIIAHNLFGRCETAGVQTRTIQDRIVAGRGGTGRGNRVLNNIFYQCARSIEFSNAYNHAEGNLYARGGGRGGGGGLNWIMTPEDLRLDLAAWQKYFNFDKQGAYAQMEIEADPDQFQLKWSCSGEVPVLVSGPHFLSDFSGADAGSKRPPGPLSRVPKTGETAGIDPRRSNR